MEDLMLNFLGLSVADLDVSYRFYHEVLGMRAEKAPELGEWAGLGETWDITKESAGHGMIVEMFGGSPSPPAGRSWGRGQNVRPAMHVPDLDRISDEFRRRGVRFTSGVTETSRGREIEFAAPEDVRWAILETTRYPTSESLETPRIGTVEVKVADLDGQIRFFEDLLGLDLAERSHSEVLLEQGPGEPVVALSPGGTPVAMPERDRSKAVMTQPVWISVMTADIHEAATRLRSKDVTIYHEIVKHEEWHGTDLIVGDADGNPVQVVQYQSA